MRGSIIGADCNELLRPTDALPPRPLRAGRASSAALTDLLDHLGLMDALSFLEADCAPLSQGEGQLRDMTRVVHGRDGSRRGRRIDVILAPPNDLALVRIVDTLTECGALSDHRPVFASFVSPDFERGRGYFRADASLVATEAEAVAFDKHVAESRRQARLDGLDPGAVYELLATETIPRYLAARLRERQQARLAGREQLQLLADTEAALPAEPSARLPTATEQTMSQLQLTMEQQGRHLTGVDGGNTAPQPDDPDDPAPTRYMSILTSLLARDAERAGQWAALHHRARTGVPSAETTVLLKGRARSRALASLAFDARPGCPAHTATGPTEIAASYAGLCESMHEQHELDSRAQARILRELPRRHSAWSEVPPLTASGLQAAAFQQRLLSAPGLDGLPTALYRVSLSLCGALADAANHAMRSNSPLPTTLRTFVIRPIPKGGRKASALVNASAWRPICLVPVGYKMLERYLLTHIEDAVNQLVDADQRGFLKGRHIYECITLAALIQAHARATGANCRSLLTLLDFDSAFCRMCTSYTRACFTRMGAPASFFPLYDVLLRGRLGRVNINGFLSATFNIFGGASQGGVLSPVLFAVSSDGFIRLLRSWRTGRGGLGIELMGNRHLTSMFADDTAVTLRDLDQLRELMRKRGPVWTFERGTNMLAQPIKTLVISLGRAPAANDARLGRLKHVRYSDAVRHLGGFINSDSGAANDITSRLAANDADATGMEERLSARGQFRDPVWRARMHAPYFLARFAHLAMTMPIADRDIVRLDRQHRAFVFRNVHGLCRPNTAAATNTVQNGGIGLQSACAWVGSRSAWLAVRLLQGDLAAGNVDSLTWWGVEHAWREAVRPPASAEFRPTHRWPCNPSDSGIAAACSFHWLTRCGLRLNKRHALPLTDTEISAEDLRNEPVWGNADLAAGFFPPRRGGHGDVTTVGDVIRDGAWTRPEGWSPATFARFLEIIPPAWHGALRRSSWHRLDRVHVLPDNGTNEDALEGWIALAGTDRAAVVLESGATIHVPTSRLGRSYVSLRPNGHKRQQPIRLAHWDVDAMLAGADDEPVPVRGLRIRDLYRLLLPGWGTRVRPPTGREGEHPFPFALSHASTADTRVNWFVFRFVQGKLPAGRITCDGTDCGLCGASRPLMNRGPRPVLSENRHDVYDCALAVSTYSLVSRHSAEKWQLAVAVEEFQAGRPTDADDAVLSLPRGEAGHQADLLARCSIISCTQATVWAHARRVFHNDNEEPLPAAALASAAIRRIATNAALLEARQRLRVSGPVRRPHPTGARVKWPRPKPQWWDGWRDADGRLSLRGCFTNPWPALPEPSNSDEETSDTEPDRDELLAEEPECDDLIWE
jgi:hypothetical protein